VATLASLEGEKELRRTLKAAGDDLADLKAAHARTADTVSVRGRQKAPRRSGRLAGSVRPSGTKTAAVIRAGGGAIPYAGVQEYGWPAHHIPAQPYLVPAAEETQPTWEAEYQADVEKILARVKGI
jgi:phage gpG-like protein